MPFLAQVAFLKSGFAELANNGEYQDEGIPATDGEAVGLSCRLR